MMLAPWTFLRGVVQQRLATRAFTATATACEKALPPRRKILDHEVTEAFLRGSGPGGQKINKTSCAVQLKHLATGIVVKSQHTRSREQNRKFARLLLGEKLDALEKGEDSRTAIKLDRARTKKASANKKTKRKYKKLEEAKAAADGGEGAEEGEGEGEGEGDEAVEDLEPTKDMSPDSSSSSEIRKPDQAP
jgi:protein subunit release factor B